MWLLTIRLAQKMEEEKRQKKAEEEMKKREAESKITPLGKLLHSFASTHAKVEDPTAEDENIGVPDFHKQLQSLHNFELEIPSLDKAYESVFLKMNIRGGEYSQVSINQ